VNGTLAALLKLYICKQKAMNFKSALSALRIVGILEGISFLSFLITMPLKYMMGITAPNKIIGMTHGVLFIAYVFLVYWASTETKWEMKTKFWAYIASLLPFGTFVADAKIFKPTQKSLKSI
jgi:integral membrane protein